MLETKCVDDKYKMLVTVLAILVTNINFLHQSFYIAVWHQHLKDITNIESQSPTFTNRWYVHQHHCHRTSFKHQLYCFHDYDLSPKDDEKCLASMLLLCCVCLGCKDFFTARHLSGAAKHYEEVFILTLRKIDSFLKDKAEVNWDFLKRFRGHWITPGISGCRHDLIHTNADREKFMTLNKQWISS